MSDTTVQTPTPEVFKRKAQERDADGCLTNISYVYNEDGTINWRKMVKPEYLKPNERLTQEKDISKLTDRELIILLGGLKELAQVRGFQSVEYRPVTAKLDYFATVCRIVWIGNYETQGQTKAFEAQAGASLSNTDGFTQNYLAEMAENRAFARCIRNFLKINIVSQEEVSKSLTDTGTPTPDVVQAGSDPLVTLVDLMTRANVTFDKVKERLVKDGNKDAENYTSVNDIPAPQIFELIDMVNIHLEKKAKKSSRTAKAAA